MNSTGKKFTAVASLAMMTALLSGNATAQVLTLHGNQATQQVTYATTGGTLDPHFPVQVQHELDPSGSNVVRATYVTQDSLLIAASGSCLTVYDDVSARHRQGRAVLPGRPCAAAVPDVGALEARQVLRRATVRLQHTLGRRGVLDQQMRRAPRPRRKCSTAIRATPLQHAGGAIRAERAFEGTDQRVVRVGRQVLVAAFAVGAHLEHGRTSAGGGSGDERRACVRTARTQQRRRSRRSPARPR